MLVRCLEVLFYSEFDPEYDALLRRRTGRTPRTIKILQQFGPHLGRPRVDTLNASKHANMKELRFDAADGVWRFAFAFDPKRRAVVLVGGDKSGGGEKRFYRQLITKADDRFNKHLIEIKKEQRKNV